MYRVQVLEMKPAPYQAAARHGKIGRTWRNVATPKRNRATAERLAQYARIDNPNNLIRVRPVVGGEAVVRPLARTPRTSD